MARNLFLVGLLLVITVLSWLLLRQEHTPPVVDSEPPPEPPAEVPTATSREIQTLPEGVTTHAWQWVETRYRFAGTERPELPEAFGLTWPEPGRVAVQTDCNSMMGSYQLDETGTLQFSEFATTLMYCEGSQEQMFAAMLQAVRGYEHTDDELRLILADQAGYMVFAVRETE